MGSVFWNSLAREGFPENLNTDALVLVIVAKQEASDTSEAQNIVPLSTSVVSGTNAEWTIFGLLTLPLLGHLKSSGA